LNITTEHVSAATGRAFERQAQLSHAPLGQLKAELAKDDCWGVNIIVNDED